MNLKPSEFATARKLSIGILSDTHNLLRPEALSNLEGSDVILHAGDVGDERIVGDLESLAPVFVVRGNVDYQYWCGRLPNVLQLSLSNLNILMIHDVGHLPETRLSDVALVIYGHSHKPEIREAGGVVYLNPGSAGPRRFSLPVTCARLEWQSGQKILAPEIIHLL